VVAAELRQGRSGFGGRAQLARTRILVHNGNLLGGDAIHDEGVIEPIQEKRQRFDGYGGGLAVEETRET
jgi:hypothetical protein